MTDPNPTKVSDALRPILEQSLEATRRLLEAADDQASIEKYSRRVAQLERLLR